MTYGMKPRRQSGAKGGKKRAALLTKAELSAIAKTAAEARWKKPTSKQLLCKEKQRLRDFYSAAAASYDEAMNMVVANRNKVGKVEYVRLRSLMDDARATRNSARTNLEHHKQHHGC